MKNSVSVGMVSNEIIHSSTSRTGGFGYATRVLMRTVEERGQGRVRFLTTDDQFAEGVDPGDNMIGARDYFKRRSVRDLVRYRLARLDVLALLDYRSSYGYFLRNRSGLPVIIWVRDPRSRADNDRFLSLREPGFPDDLPAQAIPPETGSLRGYLHPREGVVRPHVFAVSTPHLRDKIPEAYGVAPDDVPHLCTVIPALSQPAEDAKRPTVLSLARLDPQKRPWIMVELARRMPDVTFVMAGRTHAGLRWRPSDLPDNVRLVGEVKGEEKAQLLKEAWLLLNTAIHEALPVSWLEALGCGVPLVACLDPDGIVSSFGRAVPFADGVGYEMLPDLEAAVRSLIDDRAERLARGAAGLDWVRRTHNADNFAAAWAGILETLGLQRPRGRREET